jgi:phosphopantetheinyl transferase (holo-ACP synthase)
LHYNAQILNGQNRKGFIPKFFPQKEIELFKDSNFQTLSFENFVWLAWSVKESVYKFHKRHHRNISFAPTKIIINEIQLPSKQNVLDLSNEHEGISFNKACMLLL